jgi:hypothetical protein
MTTPAERCRDLDRWHKAVGEAGDLSVRRSDGRTEVSSLAVKAALWYLRGYMDGPRKPDPGANARPGLERMAEALGLSTSQAQAALRAGVTHGYLVQTARGHTGSTATYAAALPVESLRAAGPSEGKSLRAAGPSEPRASGQTAKSLRLDSEEPPASRTPPPHDLRMTDDDVGARLASEVHRQLGQALDRDAIAERARPLLDDGWTVDQLTDHLLGTFDAEQQRRGVTSPSGFLLAVLDRRPSPPATNGARAADRDADWGRRMAAQVSAEDWPDLLASKYRDDPDGRAAADAAYRAALDAPPSPVTADPVRHAS